MPTQGCPEIIVQQKLLPTKIETIDDENNKYFELSMRMPTAEHSLKNLKLIALMCCFTMQCLVQDSTQNQPHIIIDVLWGQPIKLMQDVSTSKFHEY